MLVLERNLAEDIPFGCHQHISRNISSIYMHLLSLIANEVPSARRFLEEVKSNDEEHIRHVFHDSLTRRVIEDSVCRVLRGLGTIEPSMIEELLSGAAEHSKPPTPSFLADSVPCTPLHGAFNYAYIWLNNEPNTLSGRWFRDEIVKRMSGFQLDVPTQDQIDTLHAGAAIAERITPRLARSAISHTCVIVIGSFVNRNQFRSVTVPGLPGVTVLSPTAIKDDYQAAQTLVHEALHLKFLDVDYFQQLFPVGFRPELSPKITPVWHEGTQRGNWPIDRVLTSMHVYVAMAIFLETTTLNANNSKLIDLAECSARALESKRRASWLLQRARDHFQHLTGNGRNFVEWVARILGHLEQPSTGHGVI